MRAEERREMRDEREERRERKKTMGNKEERAMHKKDKEK